MKKLLLILLAVLLLASCSESDTVTPNEPAEESVEADPCLDSEKYFTELNALKAKHAEEIEALSYSDRLIHFLDALCNGDTELVDVYLCGWGHEDYHNVKMTYNVLETAETNNPLGSYAFNAKVLFNVTESTSPTFPVGEHVYDLHVWNFPDPCYVSMEAEGPDKYFFDEPKIEDALSFSKNYWIYCGAWTPEEQQLEKRGHLIKHSLLQTKTSAEVTHEELREHLKQRLGLRLENCPEIEEYFAPLFNEEKGTYLLECSHGSASALYDIHDVVKTDKGCRIVWSLFSDFSCLEETARIIFTYEENENSDVMKLISVEKNHVKPLPVFSYAP